MRSRFIRYWVPVIAYAAGIFTVSSLPQSPAPLLFPHSDTLFHSIAYAGFAFIILRALNASRGSITGENLRLLAFLIAFLYGITDEMHQYFVPGRHAELLDILSDGLGAFAGQWFFKLNR